MSAGTVSVLEQVLAAHGGLERWRAAKAVTAHSAFGGVQRSRMPGNRMANVVVRVELGKQINVET